MASDPQRQSAIAEKLEELFAERDSLKRRIESALRDERVESYGAMGVAGALIALVLWGGASGELSWGAALVIVAVIVVIAAIAVYLIRAYGFSTVMNILSFWTAPAMDDPLEELRERLATCEERIAHLRGGIR